MNVEIGRRAKSLNERAATGVGRASFKPRLLEQKAGDDPVHDAQHWREQLGMRGEENPQRDRKRQHPIA